MLHLLSSFFQYATHGFSQSFYLVFVLLLHNHALFCCNIYQMGIHGYHGLAACMSWSSKQPSWSSWSSWSSWLPTSIRMGCSCVSRCQNQVCFGDDQGGDFASLLTRCGGSNPRSSTHHHHTLCSGIILYKLEPFPGNRSRVWGVRVDSHRRTFYASWESSLRGRF